MEKICPIQVIEQRGEPGIRWLTLAKFIHRDTKTQFSSDGTLGHYDSICAFASGVADIRNLVKLLEGKTHSRILGSDIIRNPTTEEITNISNVLLKNKYRLNLKTLKLIDKMK